MNSRHLKLVFFIILMCILVNAENAQYLNKLSLKRNYFQTDTLGFKSELSEKSPVLAGTLSFILPGAALGQIYNNVPSKIFRHLSISIGSFTLLMIAGEFGWFRMDIACGANNHDTWIPFSLVLIYLGNWIWSVVDAVITANEINKQIKLQKYRSDVLNKIKFGLTLDKNKQLNLKFALEF